MIRTCSRNGTQTPLLPHHDDLWNCSRAVDFDRPIDRSIGPFHAQRSGPPTGAEYKKSSLPTTAIHAPNPSSSLTEEAKKNSVVNRWLSAHHTHVNGYTRSSSLATGPKSVSPEQVSRPVSSERVGECCPRWCFSTDRAGELRKALEFPFAILYPILYRQRDASVTLAMARPLSVPRFNVTAAGATNTTHDA